MSIKKAVAVAVLLLVVLSGYAFAQTGAAASTQNIDKRLVGGTWHPDCGGYESMTFNENGTLGGSKNKWHTKGDEIIITYSNGKTHKAKYSIDENGFMSYAGCESWFKSKSR